MLPKPMLTRQNTPARNENYQPPCFLYPSPSGHFLILVPMFPLPFRHEVIFLENPPTDQVTHLSPGATELSQFSTSNENAIFNKAKPNAKLPSDTI
ncbi:hypothetical protein TNCV_3508381 [Trichonephila clavipes]|nr:hypothetical protein TNCV_3508381 [Trichonephila clavipes]